MARKGNWKDLYDMYTGILNFEWPIQVGIIYGPNIRNWMVVGPLVIWAIIIALVIPGEVPNPIWR